MRPGSIQQTSCAASDGWGVRNTSSTPEHLHTESTMWRNYLRIAARTLLKERLFSGINIVGLAVGLACCLLLGLYVRDELQYDRFHQNADRLYRVTMDGADREKARGTTPPRSLPPSRPASRPSRRAFGGGTAGTSFAAAISPGPRRSTLRTRASSRSSPFPSDRALRTRLSRTRVVWCSVNAWPAAASTPIGQPARPFR